MTHPRKEDGTHIKEKKNTTQMTSHFNMAKSRNAASHNPEKWATNKKHKKNGIRQKIKNNNQWMHWLS